MKLPKVIVIDYGVGNLLSVKRGLEKCGAKVILTSNPKLIIAAERVVLPGVGAFANAMKTLKNLGLVEVLGELAQRKTPLLGICLGMQLLLEESEEFGLTTGLGLIPGRVISIPNQTISGEKQKIPHIGWSALQTSNSKGWQDTLMQNNRSGEAAYFVHSFMAVPSDPTNRIADCIYGGHKIAGMIGRDQITGCQFHPEKSGEVGLEILRNFCVD
jgi:glutamine amidotransferase